MKNILSLVVCEIVCAFQLQNVYAFNSIFLENTLFRRHQNAFTIEKPKSTRTTFFATNPNDLETPEERSARMDLVRQLQKSFYQPDAVTNPNKSEVVSSFTDADDLLNPFQDSINPNILHDLPLWRVQWSELPGYQNVLNVHVPHYTHMFRTLFAKNPEPPWYFGHLYLEDGSENLENPEYALDPDPETGESRTKACLTGTLMQVVDYKENEYDGRLMLIVQGLEKFKVISPLSVPKPRDDCDTIVSSGDGEMDDNCYLFENDAVTGDKQWKHPYATATVELIPDQELIERHYYGNIIHSESPKSSLWKEAHVLAIAEGSHWRKFECRSVNIEECIAGGGGISPLINYDSLQAEQLEKTSLDVLKKTNNFFIEQSKNSEQTSDGYLFQSDLAHKASDSVNLDIRNAALPDMEFQVWVALDRMIRLLIQANPYKNVNVPIPAQMLNLLPVSPPPNKQFAEKWPGFFQLHKYAETLRMNENTLVGTATKSPFVQVDSMNLSSYPDLRRARRLSFAVWFLLDTILATDEADEDELTRQDVLEMESIFERLKAAKKKLDAINGTLKFVLSQSR